MVTSVKGRIFGVLRLVWLGFGGFDNSLALFPYLMCFPAVGGGVVARMGVIVRL